MCITLAERLSQKTSTVFLATHNIFLKGKDLVPNLDFQRVLTDTSLAYLNTTFPLYLPVP